MIGRHANEAELLTEELDSLKDAIGEVKAQVSWHATRYAMDGDRVRHDAVLEALWIIRDVIDHDSEPIECNCTWPDQRIRDAQVTPHEHQWADIHGVIGCSVCRIAKDDVSGLVAS